MVAAFLDSENPLGPWGFSRNRRGDSAISRIIWKLVLNLLVPDQGAPVMAMNPLSGMAKSAVPRKIARRPVVSSMMRSAGYDEDLAVLEIEFVTGSVYRYHAVPKRAWTGLMEAGSKGRYFDAHIRDKYPVRRVG
jgi:KTSC domain